MMEGVFAGFVQQADAVSQNAIESRL